MKHKSINVLILGSGGREHAIAWKIKQSPFLNKSDEPCGICGKVPTSSECANDIQ